MPANLSPDYLAAEREFREATSQAEKVAALERMLATVPKHKGTEKLQADLKHRLSQARKESPKKGAARSTPFYLVEKEGAGQVVLVGPANSGKSQLLAAVTHAHPEIAAYPFTTRTPLPGMMTFENIQIQLIDMPPVSAEFTEPWTPQVLQVADAAVLIVDANAPDVLDEVDFIAARFAEWRVAPLKLLVASKIDLPGAPVNFETLDALYAGRFRSLAVSAATGQNLEAFRRALFDLLGIIRVYTKPPGKKAELNAPYVLARGRTVQDAARMVHKDFAEHLKYARLFRGSGGPDGLMAERTHVLEDGDILELHL